MKIAVTYENGSVFQHFGHTEQFKIYEILQGKIVKSQIVSTNGNGHGALAGILSEQGVDTLICGGIGAGAQTALANAGIQLYGGVSGNADAAVNSFWLEHLPTIPMCSVITTTITMRNIPVAGIMEIVTHREKCNLNLALVWFRKDKTKFFGESKEVFPVSTPKIKYIL